jgi:hypothetical protein
MMLEAEEFASACSIIAKFWASVLTHPLNA